MARRTRFKHPITIMLPILTPCDRANRTDALILMRCARARALKTALHAQNDAARSNGAARSNEVRQRVRQIS